MKRAMLFILTTMMVGCAEQQVFDTATWDEPVVTTETESLNDLMAQAKWGDGKAYLKLAEYYINGQNGTKPDFMATMSMLSMAEEYGAIRTPGEYMSTLPEDNNTRIVFEAIESIESTQYEKGMELADRLIGNGYVDGYALKGYACMEMGDTIEAKRLAMLAAEQGSSLGRALQYIIPYVHQRDMPDESVITPLAEVVPFFYLFMAEEYLNHQSENSENEEKAVRCYLKADENGCLDRRGANFLLAYMKNGGSLPLSDTELQRLSRLAEYVRIDTATAGYDESENDV